MASGDERLRSLEQRAAVVETEVKETRADVSDMRSDVREARGEIRDVRDELHATKAAMDANRVASDSQFRDLASRLDEIRDLSKGNTPPGRGRQGGGGSESSEPAATVTAKKGGIVIDLSPTTLSGLAKLVGLALTQAGLGGFTWWLARMVPPTAPAPTVPVPDPVEHHETAPADGPTE